MQEVNLNAGSTYLFEKFSSFLFSFSLQVEHRRDFEPQNLLTWKVRITDYTDPRVLTFFLWCHNLLIFLKLIDRTINDLPEYPHRGRLWRLPGLSIHDDDSFWQYVMQVIVKTSFCNVVINFWSVWIKFSTVIHSITEEVEKLEKTNRRTQYVYIILILLFGYLVKVL